jgi:hypothetical protein
MRKHLFAKGPSVDDAISLAVGDTTYCWVYPNQIGPYAGVSSVTSVFFGDEQSRPTGRSACLGGSPYCRYRFDRRRRRWQGDRFWVDVRSPSTSRSGAGIRHSVGVSAGPNPVQFWHGGAADGSDSTERPMTLANLPVDRVSSTTAVCGGLRFQTLFSLAYDSVQFVW